MFTKSHLSAGSGERYVFFQFVGGGGLFLIGSELVPSFFYMFVSVLPIRYILFSLCAGEGPHTEFKPI